MAGYSDRSSNYSDEEFCAVLYTALLEKSMPCSCDELCLTVRGLSRHTGRARVLLDQMCASDEPLVVKVEHKYILKDKWQPSVDRSLSCTSDVSLDGPLSQETAFPPHRGQDTVLSHGMDRPLVPVRQFQSQVSVSSGCDPDAASANTDILRRIVQTLSLSDVPLKAKDVAQKAGIGTARSDVNRYLYFLEAKRIVQKDENARWRAGGRVTDEDLKVHGAELAKRPPARQKGKPTQGTQPLCSCPNAGPGCVHVTNIQQNNHYYNLQVGDKSSMFTGPPQDPRLRDN